MLTYSDTTKVTAAIIQGIESRLFPGATTPITGNTSRFQDITREVNLAQARAWDIAFKAAGKRWIDDDPNLSGLPIITTDLVDGQRDYDFSEDQYDNKVFALHALFVKNTNTNGVYQMIHPVDPTTDEGMQGFTDGLNAEAVPFRYQKIGTRALLDPIPSENVTDGLKAYVSREGSYFTTSDTTKVSGLPVLHHEYLIVRPAYQWGVANRFDAATLANWRVEMLDLEKRIEDFFGVREKDRRTIITQRKRPFK